MGLSEDRINAIRLTPEELKAYGAMRGQLDALHAPVRELMRSLYNIDVPAVENYFPQPRDWQAYEAEATPKTDPATGQELPYDEMATWKWLRDDYSPRPTTSVEKGFTKERVTGATSAVKLNAFDVFRQHIQDVTHLLTTQRELKMLGEIARTPDFRSKFGQMGQGVVVDWLDTVARQGGIESYKRIKFLDTLRKTTSVGSIAFRIASQFKHLSNAAYSMAHVGPVWWGKGLGQVATAEGQAFMKAALRRNRRAKRRGDGASRNREAQPRRRRDLARGRESWGDRLQGGFLLRAQYRPAECAGNRPRLLHAVPRGQRN